MHGLKLDDVEAVGQHTIRFALEQMFAFIRGNMRDGRKNVRTMCGGALDAVAVVDSTLAGFVVDVEVLQVIVEIHRASTEVTAKQGRVCSEDCGHIDLTLSAKRDGKPSLPLVEVGNDRSARLPGDVLRYRLGKFQPGFKVLRTSPKNQATR